MSISAYKLTASSSSYTTLYFHPSAIGDGAKALNASAYLSLNGKMNGVAYYASFVSLFAQRPSGWPTSITIQDDVYASGFVGTQTTHSSLEDYGSSLYTIETNSYPLSHTVSRATLYTRDFSASDGGSVDVTVTKYGFATQSCTPTAFANHEFVEWRNVSNDSAVEPTTGLSIDSTTKKITVLSTYAADVAVYAYFRATKVALGVSVSGTGTATLRIDGTLQGSLTGHSLDRTTVHTIRVVASPGYGQSFYRWGISVSQDGGATTTSYSTTADYTFYTDVNGADTIAVVGYFVTRPTAALNVSKVNPTFGTISVTLPDAAATVISEVNNVLSLDAYEGYAYILHAAVTVPADNYFLGWFSSASDVTLVSASADYTRTITSGDVSSGVTLYAVFREKADITVTSIVLLEGTVEAVNRDGNLIAPVVAGTLNAGDNEFAVTINAGHYWGKPDLTVTEVEIGTSAAYNTLSIPAADYTIDADGHVTLKLSPVQAWTTGQTAIAFEVSADFPAIPVGATVVEGANAGTYSWMYSAISTAWAGRAASPDPDNPLYGDTGTVTVTPVDATHILIGRVTVKFGEVTVLDQATAAGTTDEEFVFTVGDTAAASEPTTGPVTGPITITVQMKATVTVNDGGVSFPAGVTFSFNAVEDTTPDGNDDYTAVVVVGEPCAVDYLGSLGSDVFDGWAIAGFEAYVDGNGDMKAVNTQSDVHPVVVIPNGNTTLVPRFVTADAAPFVALAYYNASTTTAFIPGGTNPTVTTVGGSVSTQTAMGTQIGSGTAGSFETAFPTGGTVSFFSFGSLETLTLTAVGTTALPFLGFEKAYIAKGNGSTEDCVIGPWSSAGNVNPSVFTIISSCAYRAVFGAYTPQTNTAAYQTSAMRTMGAINVTGYGAATAVNGSVTASTGYGDTVTWAASPNVGYVFSGWYSLSGSTYTLVSAAAEYEVEQDSLARVLYAAFAQDTTKLYEMEAGEVNKTMTWKSKRFEMGRPAAFSACRCDADGYPVTLQVHAFSSPSLEDETGLGITVCEDQDSRRLPTLRKERFFEFSVESVHPVVGMSFSTTMQGLS